MFEDVGQTDSTYAWIIDETGVDNAHKTESVLGFVGEQIKP